MGNSLKKCHKTHERVSALRWAKERGVYGTAWIEILSVKYTRKDRSGLRMHQFQYFEEFHSGIQRSWGSKVMRRWVKGMGMKKTRYLLIQRTGVLPCCPSRFQYPRWANRKNWTTGTTLSSWACWDDNGHYSRKNIRGGVESKAAIVDMMGLSILSGYDNYHSRPWRQGGSFASHVKNLPLRVLRVVGKQPKDRWKAETK